MLKYQVCEMLDLFSLKTGKFKKVEAPCKVKRDIIHEVINVVREPCSEKGLALDYIIDEQVPEMLILDA